MIASPRHFVTWTPIKITGATKKLWNYIEKARILVEDKTLGSIGIKLSISLSITSKTYYILSCYHIKLEIL